MQAQLQKKFKKHGDLCRICQGQFGFVEEAGGAIVAQ
jgi:hypothetical protein